MRGEVEEEGEGTGREGRGNRERRWRSKIRINKTIETIIQNNNTKQS
jgi:hypothetical protein